MLEAKFFLEVQGQTKGHRSKTYEVNYVQENDDESQYCDEYSFAFAADASDVPDALID